MNVYVDNYNESMFEWIEEEENEDQDYSCEKDEDSILSVTYSIDHEEDDAEYPFPANKTMGDRFLNKFCLHRLNVDDLYDDAEYVQPQYPVHDDRQPWNRMKPLLGMRFSNPDELKNMLSNYAVANGYDLWFEKMTPKGRDENNHIYPITWALVGVENKATWKWFIDLLMDDIDGGLGVGITLLSYGHKGLLEAIKERCPEAGHRQCARHIVDNFAKRLWGVTPCSYQKYEVRFDDAACGVDLIAKTCACRIWQLTTIPCLHGVAVISSLNQDAETYVSQSYNKEAYLKCYNYSTNPLNGSDMWPEVPSRKPLPPRRIRLPGRPLVKRKRDAVEKELSGPVRHSVTRRGALIRGSGSGPSQPPPVAAAQPSQPTPATTTQPAATTTQPPQSPPAAATAARPVPRMDPIGRSGRRQYSERIVKMALRRNIPGVGSSAENPAVLD
ncbi:unnamed protein product [Lactuca saligna]|uniref:SWIM-type domain-containing protein n=1 Tax=Lactuca saligna TaxID=75948 RepID=A0AA35Y8G5_LACSI|nr:unnamed protein product [Lactuca saligna]